VRAAEREIALRDARRMVRVMQEVGGASGQALAKGWLVADTLGSWADYAVGLGMHGTEPDSRVQQLVDYYVSRGRVPRIQVTEGADLNWVHSLTSAGFKFYDRDNVLMRPLVAPLERRSTRISFTRVDPTDSEHLDQWVQAQCQGFTPHETPSQGAIEIARRVAGSPRTLCLLVFWEGALAASGGVEFYEQSSVLFGGATLPEFRKRGLQSALIDHRLDLALERGAAYALVASEPEGGTERNARRAGFELNHQVLGYKR
jgi:GNAT superfamily N-acetyltransferase